VSGGALGSPVEMEHTHKAIFLRVSVMPLLELIVRSSSSDEVYFLKAYETHAGVRFTCSCPAGENGQHCTHRIALANGDTSRLVQPNDVAVKALITMLSTTSIPQTVKRIVELEQIAASIKKEISDEKKKLSILFHG
jgi:hypothetical protein